jgi:hypothetical protein
MVWMALSIVLLSALGILGLRSRFTKQPIDNDVVRFTVGPPENVTFASAGASGATSSATISPDGRMLAADRTEKGATNVYTMWPNGTHAQLIMRNASSPAWSDDGTHIFVQRDLCPTSGGCDASDEDTVVVYSVAPDGTDAHPVGDGDYDVSQPGWPPGQNVLAFLEQDRSNDAQGGPAEVNSLDATWSPDETQLAVADSPTGLWVVDSDGNPRLLAKGSFSSLSWGTERASASPSTSTPPAAESARR